MNFIHYTREFEKKVDENKKNLIYKKVEDLKFIDSPESLRSIDSYSKVLVLIFSGSNNCRVIIQPEWIEINGSKVHVYFVRDFISNKGFDYFWGNVIFPQLRSGDWINKHPLPELEKQAFIDKYLLDQKREEEVRPILPEYLTQWLEGFSITLNFDIYERESWVLFSNDRTNGLLEKHILLYRDILKAIINGTNISKIVISSLNEENNLYTAIYEPFNIGIIYNDFESIENQKTKRSIILHDGADIKLQNERWDKAIQKAKSEANLLKNDLLSISKDAFRAYPKWIVTNDNDELWNAIQRYDGSHNLSLLPEQVSFLSNFKFPAYINGQAGSGKSTMLYYLFANVFFYKCLDQMSGDIIFLTENDNLLEHTSKSIIGLLSNNPEFNVGLSIEDRNNVRKHFSSFKNYLLGILPEETRAHYASDKYLDFAKFKEKFNTKFAAKKYSAEEAWFVISTYVYGYYDDKIMDSIEKYTDEKNGIPSKFRVFEANHFKGIIDNYLPFYNKLIDEGWWDKITLVRNIRNFFPNYLPKQYTVVFCDEAQDFSRIELRLIIQSSEFTKYDLSKTKEIPIVFAGDALQTVSPTGFSDTRLHQMYYESFNEANFEYSKTRSTYNPTYNYRSLQPIVKLANIIQNYRKESLKEDVVIKQVAKRESNGYHIPILHTKEWLLNNNNRNLFETKFKYKSFIVPVDLNEENGYIKNEILLNGKFSDIKSSIDAKGAEYSQVVVYGFGDQYLKEFGSLSWETNDYDFKKKFFFNKLYVAITRAQNELVIIDSENGCNNFWRPLLNIPKSVKDRWEFYNDVNDVLPISPGTGLNDIKDSTPDEALNNATIDMEQGINDRNIARLIVASNVFLMLGRIEESNNCLGHKELIKEEWVKAGSHFIKAHKLEEAAKAFFQAKCWGELLNSKTMALQGNNQEIRLLVGRLMSNGAWSKEELGKAYELRGVLSSVLRDIRWIEEFFEKIEIYVNSISNLEDKRDVVFILESIVDEGNIILWKLIGKLYFATKQYTNAIEAWTRVISVSEPPVYFPEFIGAQIEKAKDEKSFHDELLWSGRLLHLDLSLGEQNQVSKKIIELYTNNENVINASEIRSELYCHIYHSLIILGELSGLSEIGTIIESNIEDFNRLSSLYTTLIKNCTHEGISIFLKERWVKAKSKALKYNCTDKESDILEIINTDFSDQNFPFSDSNAPWTKTEIKEISEYPKAFSTKPDDHLKNLVINNFRRFEEIEIQNIGQFNLILGNNNSGKTTLLESFLFSPDPNECLLNFLYSKKQRNNNAEKEKDYLLFNNLINRNSLLKNIKYTLKDGRRFWIYTLRNPTIKELIGKFETDSVDPKSYLAIEINKSETFISDRIDNIAFRLNEPQALKEVPFVPFGKGYSEKLSAIYFNEIGSKRNLRMAFVEQMKVFIPDIIDITIDPENDIIRIEENVNNEDRSSALNDYGEGANKLFRILVQLHAAKGKRLMIDEIDAGIHFSNFKDFWRIILTIADDYNVQLFATTHNLECVKYFNEILEDNVFSSFRNKSRVITLRELPNHSVKAYTRSYAEFGYELNHELEIRGGGDL